MFAMNQHVVRMQFVLPKIRMQFVNVHRATEEIQFQKSVVNWPMHVHTVPNHQFVKYHQRVKQFVNAHKDTRVIQIQPVASQLVNVHTVIPIARIVPNVSVAVVSINAMIYAVRI